MKTVRGTPSSPPRRDRGVDTSRNDDTFASHAQTGPGATGPSPAAEPGAPGSRLVAPEVDEGRGELRRAMDGGSGLLDELHGLSVDMVEGWLSEDGLHRLASLVEQAGRGSGGRDLPSALGDVAPRAATDLVERDDRAS